MHPSFFSLGLHIVDLFCSIIWISLNVILFILRMQYGIDKNTETLKGFGVAEEALTNILGIEVLEVV